MNNRLLNGKEKILQKPLAYILLTCNFVSCLCVIQDVQLYDTFQFQLASKLYQSAFKYELTLKNH